MAVTAAVMLKQGKHNIAKHNKVTAATEMTEEYQIIPACDGCGKQQAHREWE
jgi:hypothetical protein